MKKICRAILFILILIPFLASCSHNAVIKGRQLSAKNFNKMFRSKGWIVAASYSIYDNDSKGKKNHELGWVGRPHLQLMWKDGYLYNLSIDTGKFKSIYQRGSYIYDEKVQQY